MIIESAMAVVLTGMGIYFVKSTDLPKDLKDIAARNKGSSMNMPTKRKMAFENKQNNENNNMMPKVNKPIMPMEKKTNLPEATRSMASNLDVKLQSSQEKLRELEAKKAHRIALIQKKIDELTVIITTLEQELKNNQERNSEIQKEINKLIDSLIALEQSKIA